MELFNLKWIVQDKPADYECLLPDQYINHFQNNKEITSKAFLSKNLKAHLDTDLNSYVYCPQTYDFSFPEEAKRFVKDYYANCLFCILKRHVAYFRERMGERWAEVGEEARRLVHARDEVWASKGDRIYFFGMKMKPPFVGDCNVVCGFCGDRHR